MDEEVNQARLAANAAKCDMYANPNEDSRIKWLAAVNEYYKIRRKLDPDFRASRLEAQRKSNAKRKAGLTKKS